MDAGYIFSLQIKTAQENIEIESHCNQMKKGKLINASVHVMHGLMDITMKEHDNTVSEI